MDVGGLFFAEEAVRTASRRDGPDAVRDGSKSTKRPPTASSPPDAIDATRKKINRRRNTPDRNKCDAPRRYAAADQFLLEEGARSSFLTILAHDLMEENKIEMPMNMPQRAARKSKFKCPSIRGLSPL